MLARKPKGEILVTELAMEDTFLRLAFLTLLASKLLVQRPGQQVTPPSVGEAAARPAHNHCGGPAGAAELLFHAQ